VKRFLTNWWVVSGLIVLFLLLIFCVGLPLIVGWFRSWWVIAAFAVLILGGWGLLAFLRARRAKQANDAIMAQLAAPSAGDQESAALNARMAEALGSLKSATGNRRDYLYSRPWYVIIGPPGAGKTTALLNSGLRFPFADQSLKGVGGTRNLDFWFADEAALVDTAGRYTTQDSDSSVDAQGWRSFLSLLKKHRPLQPINGILIAIGVDELLKGSRANLDTHAAAVRRRLAELRSTLEVSVPAYLILTKADLLAGFCEFYDDLDVEGRRAVLGATLPISTGKPDPSTVVIAFDRLVASQSERQAKRLFEEVDATRRSLILGFPAQLGALRARLARFVDGAFIAGDQATASLRGFYFTSGVQDGAPLDRILSGVAEVYDTRTSARGQSGRTYFLNRLLSDVVFAEAGLVQMDPAARARLRRRTIIGVSAVAASALLIAALWSVSFMGNRGFQQQLLASTQQVQTLTRETGVDLVEVRGTDPDLEQSLSILRSLRNLPQGYADRAKGEPGLFMTFGLFQSGHAEQAIEAYRDGLRRILLPRVLMRLEQYMGENAANALEVYEPLKVYLMLGGQGPLDAGAVKSWVTADWAGQVLPGADREVVRKELEQHLSALLEDKNMAAAWPGRKAPLDGAAVASARAALQTLSLADRAYAVLRQKAASSAGTPWQASTAVSAGDAQAFANGPDVVALTVPYFYTRVGFEKSYQLGLATVQEDLKRDLWIMGGDASTEGVQAQMGNIRPGVAALYARDYIEQWDRVVSSLQPAAYFSDQAAFGAFTKTPSPLKLILLELRKNTTFAGGSGAAKGMIASAITQRLGRAAALAPQAGAGVDAGVEITSHFQPVHDYVGDGKTPAPVDEFVAAIKQAGSAAISAKLAGGGMGSDAVQSALAMAVGSVGAASAGAPPQLQAFVAAAAKGGSQAQVGAAQGAVSEAYAKVVLPDCQAATQEKYPFVGTSEADASMIDVQRTFGMNGTLEAFLSQRLLPMLETAGPIWRWKTEDPVAATLDPASPNEFAKTQQLRDMIAAGLSIKVEAQSFGGGVTSAEFSSGGTKYRFDPASMAPKPLIWSSQGSLPEAAVILYKGDSPVAKIETQGPWALFRLMDKAKRENAGPSTLLATFGQGDVSAVFRISLPSDRNPFGRGGLWSFRCPAIL
jgi:type VI secretion system protein ImpL